VEDIGVHGEIQKVVVTSVVMRLFVFCQVRQELARTFVIQLLVLGSRPDPALRFMGRVVFVP